MNSASQQAFKSALILCAFALISTSILAGIFYATRETVIANERAAHRALLTQVLPNDYTNQPENEFIALKQTDCAQLLLEAPCQIHLAKRHETIIGYAVETIAPNGYAGAIKLIVGLTPKGSVFASRVTQHRETPGLGDYIEEKKSEWIQQFNDQAAEGVTWKVKKDQGDFDFVAGATISARAVTHAIGRAQTWFLSSQFYEPTNDK